MLLFFLQSLCGRTTARPAPFSWATGRFSRTLMQTTGRKDFISAGGVGPLQDFPPEPPGHIQCPIVYSVSTNYYKGAGDCKDGLLSPWDTSATV